MSGSQVLSSVSALNPGADLWIVPEFDSSRWTQKLDWYLNFQILRNHRHSMPEVRNYTLYVQNQTGLEPYRAELPKTAPLMINSEAFFPNKWVVVVPVANEFRHWVEEVSKVWDGLKHPSLRVFLPTGLSASSFFEEWKNHHTFEDFTVVLD
jgi:hypothetical protein